MEPTESVTGWLPVTISSEAPLPCSMQRFQYECCRVFPDASLYALLFQIWNECGWGMHLKENGKWHLCFHSCFLCVWHVPLPRSMSLSTIAILNSVKKAVESNSRRRNRSIGVLPFTLNSESLGKMHNHGKSYGGSIKHRTTRFFHLRRSEFADWNTVEASFSFLLKWFLYYYL